MKIVGCKEQKTTRSLVRTKEGLFKYTRDAIGFKDSGAWKIVLGSRKFSLCLSFPPLWVYICSSILVLFNYLIYFFILWQIITASNILKFSHFLSSPLAVVLPQFQVPGERKPDWPRPGPIKHEVKSQIANTEWLLMPLLGERIAGKP